MFIESHMEKLLSSIPVGMAIPLRVVLWNGREFNLSSEPTVTIHVPTPSALQYFIAPDLHKLGEAYLYQNQSTDPDSKCKNRYNLFDDSHD